jgi:hypothetical protein
MQKLNDSYDFDRVTPVTREPGMPGDAQPSIYAVDNLPTCLYDGWNLIRASQINSAGAATSRQGYAVGPDIASGCGGCSSWQSAGGVGRIALRVVDLKRKPRQLEILKRSLLLR